MTKFELPEKPKKTNTSEDFNNLRKAVDELDKFDYAWKTYADKADRRINAANKHIEELERENQRLKADYNNQAESILSMLDEIKSLKSQLQQQALPVVPEFVGEFVSGYETELSKADRIAYLLKSVEGDNYYLEEYLTNAGIISQEQGEHLYAWATNQTHETILKLWNGYTVEKPQLFYLKHIDMSKADKELDYYLAKEEDGTLSHDMPNKGQFPWHPESRFTQQEIDSMETGSYEQIPVPVEDAG